MTVYEFLACPWRGVQCRDMDDVPGVRDGAGDDDCLLYSPDSGQQSREHRLGCEQDRVFSHARQDHQGLADEASLDGDHLGRYQLCSDCNHAMEEAVHPPWAPGRSD